MEELDKKRILGDLVKRGLVSEKTVKLYFDGEGNLKKDCIEKIKTKIKSLEEELKK